MRMVHIAMIALAIVQLVLTGFTALVGGFADGGSVWERALIMVVHPAAAIALLVMVLTPRADAKRATRVAVVLLLVNIGGDAAVYAAISQGAIKGDKSLALIFAIIPVIGVVYGLARGTGKGQKAADNSEKYRWLPWLIFPVIITVWIGYWYIMWISGWFPELDKGQFGDVFGAVNALFAGLAFAGIIWAIILQKEELELQRKELKETRTELQKQSFESSFFQLLGFYKEIVNSVKGQTSQHSGREYFAHLLSSLRRKYRKRVEECKCNSPEKDILKATYEEFFIVFYPNIGYYFRHLYNVIKFVDQNDSIKTLKEKRFYTDLIRAQLSSNELGLLFFYCLNDQKFKALVEKFAFFTYMPSEEFICDGTPFEELTCEEYRDLYKKSAYGESDQMDDQ